MSNSIQRSLAHSALEMGLVDKTENKLATSTISAPALTSPTTQISAVSAALSSVSALSDVRTDKVAAIQSAMAAGTYRVNAQDVADSLIRSMLE